jgi:hypothetical protein
LQGLSRRSWSNWNVGGLGCFGRTVEFEW